MVPIKTKALSTIGIQFLILFGIVQAAHAITWTPKIIRQNRKITVQSNPNAIAGNKMSLEILESNLCDSQILDSKALSYSESCELLHGVLKYQFNSENEQKLKKVYVEFLLTQSSSKNHAFLVNSPVIIDGE